MFGFENTPRNTYGLSYDIAGSIIFIISNIWVFIDSISWLAGGKGYYQACIEPPFCGFGAGDIMHLNNVSLTFDLSRYNTSRVSFIFMDQVGDENLRINTGTLYIVSRLSQVPTAVAPGVTCIVDSISADTCGAGWIGRVNLQSSIDSLRIAGQELWLDSLCLEVVTTSLPENSDSYQPEKYFLGQNYPNPFNPSTRIRFTIPKDVNVKLIIYDIFGREVCILLNEKRSAGNHQVKWNANNYASGIYFYKIITEDFTLMRKMLFIK